MNFFIELSICLGLPTRAWRELGGILPLVNILLCSSSQLAPAYVAFLGVGGSFSMSLSWLIRRWKMASFDCLAR